MYSEIMPQVTIAMLGWGSLIWDSRLEFDSQVGGWANGGPVLPLEFCRISDSRQGALTLVVDTTLDTKVETFYALSRRLDPRDALQDLRIREVTSHQNIGFIDVANGEERSRDGEVLKIIKSWAAENDIDTVIWTDLESNFSKKKFVDFSFEEALNHLRDLDSDGIREAVRYITKTPEHVNTGFREWLATNEWFTEQVALYGSDT